MDDAQAGPDTAVKADSKKVAAGAPVPAPKAEPVKASADTCVLARALAAWSDSSLAEKRYGVYVTVRLAAMEAESTPFATAADSTVATRLCQAARERKLDPFLAIYRPVRPTTVLTQDVVRTLGEIAAPITASARDTANRAVPSTRDTANGTSNSIDGEEQKAAPIPARVQVPRRWLAALIGLIAIAGAALGYGLWRLGWMIRNSEHQVRESHYRHIEHSARTLKDDVGKAQQTTLAETGNYFRRLGEELAALRDQMAENRRGGAGTDARPGADDGRGLHGEGGRKALVLEPNPHAQWETTTVDVRPANEGSATIHADDTYGVFTVRWARDSGAQAWLSVDPSRALGAVYQDKLNAAFRRQGVSRGTDKYLTLHEALCTWDPVTAQGRIDQPGLVEEV